MTIPRSFRSTVSLSLEVQNRFCILAVVFKMVISIMQTIDVALAVPSFVVSSFYIY